MIFFNSTVVSPILEGEEEGLKERVTDLSKTSDSEGNTYN